jgi:hypothetical protein
VVLLRAPGGYEDRLGGGMTVVGHGGHRGMRANRMARQREGGEGKWKARNGARRVPWCSPIEQSARSRVREEDARRPWWRLSGAWPPRP